MTRRGVQAPPRPHTITYSSKENVMGKAYDELYEHIVRLEGDIKLFRATDDYVTGTLILVFQGAGQTRADRWFAQRERYVFLATRDELLRLARTLVDETPKSLSAFPEVLPAATNAQVFRDRLWNSHQVDVSYIRHARHGVTAYSGPALILEVEHDDEVQHRHPRPVVESEPYRFLCDQEQLLALAQDILAGASAFAGKREPEVAIAESTRLLWI